MKLLTHCRPSAAMVVACAALLVSLGGVSYAAIKLPKNSVGTKQIINRSVRTIDLSKRTVGAITGQAGPQGPGGATNVVIRIGSPGTPVPNHYLASGVSCNPAERATGGGYLFTGTDQPDDVINYNGPAPATGPIQSATAPTRWAAQAYDVNGDDTANTMILAYVVCASP
jgi:hypothetical protein